MRFKEYKKGIVLKDIFPWMRTYDERMVIALVKIYRAITIYTVENNTPRDTYYFEIGDRSEYIYETDKLRLIGVVTNYMLDYLNIGCVVNSDNKKPYIQYRALYTNTQFDLLNSSRRKNGKRDGTLRLLSIIRHKYDFNALIENYDRKSIPINKPLQFISEDGEIVANGVILKVDTNTSNRLRYIQLKLNPGRYKNKITYTDYENTIIKEVEVQK